MLENGNGVLTLAEQRSHFTAWALAKSPLLVGTDVCGRYVYQEVTNVFIGYRFRNYHKTPSIFYSTRK